MALTMEQRMGDTWYFSTESFIQMFTVWIGLVGFLWVFLVVPLVLLEELGFYPIQSRELFNLLEQGTA